MRVDKTYLPSRKFVISLSTAIALVIIIFVIKFIGTNEKETSIFLNNNQIVIQNIKDIKTIDTDKDNLVDWEETLWKTDPRNPDTDGDGTLDGDEITQGRNPLVPNTAGKNKEPNDKIDPTIVANNTKDEEEWNSLNETQRFSRSLFSDYIAVQPADGSKLTTDQINELVANSVANIPDKPLEQKYTSTDLKIIDNPTAKDISNYSIKINKIINSNEIKNNVFKEISIANTFLTKEDPAILSGIDKIITLYQKTSEEIINTETPAEIADSHLLLANSIYSLSLLAKDLKAVDTNPIISLTTAKKYDKVIQDFSRSISNINLYISNKSS
ncbi:MAG: hypothetical protein WCC74_01435 [Minisyncoccia bacterium]